MTAPCAAASTLETTGIPAGFDELAGPRVSLVDVYFGELKIGEAFAVTRPGTLRFRSPGDVLAKLPNVVTAPEILAAISGELPTNSSAACAYSNAGDCGVLKPQVIGIIYDESRFRVDVFVNPQFLRTAHSVPEGFLPLPAASLSLTNALGLSATGTIGGASSYNFQNRTIVALGNARVRANSSVASRLGIVVDDLVGEVDGKELRYSAGLFWAPGTEFTGRRRIVGMGVGTQFDTRNDREELRGTPLIVFLAQPARVELFVDGRLVTSRSYPAGNNDIDTSALADGSYPVLLRIHQSNGSVREERRFFVKNAQVAPVGHPVFYAYGGLLANTRAHHPISPSGTLYYQAGAAWRLTDHWALDVAVLGTQHKMILEGGGWLLRGAVRLRLAGLVSSAADKGALVQLSSGGHGPLNISFDLRRIWSYDGKPLIPLASYVDSFEGVPPTGVQLANGSYTQATGSVGLRLGSGFLSLVGSYRKDRHGRADYTIGPSATYRLVTRNQVQVVLEASAQRTRTTTAAFAGLRVLFTSGPMSMLSSIGRSFQEDRTGLEPSVSRVISSFTAQYSYETGDRTSVNAGAGIDRGIDTSTVHAGGTVASRLGNIRADLLHNLEGRGGTQYDLAFQSGIAVGSHAAAWAGRDLYQSALVVSVAGDAPDAIFTVLVDDVARGRVSIGRRLSLFVPGYRTYRVRLVPAAVKAVSYDTAARQVTLYPGNVRSLVWRADSYFTAFGQVVSPAGAPLANALVRTAKGIGETDSKGYFQIDTRRGEPITIVAAGGSECRAQPGDVIVRQDFASIGKVICR